jgi:hypothetical protein
MHRLCRNGRYIENKMTGLRLENAVAEAPREFAGIA